MPENPAYIKSIEAPSPNQRSFNESATYVSSGTRIAACIESEQKQVPHIRQSQNGQTSLIDSQAEEASPEIQEENLKRMKVAKGFSRIADESGTPSKNNLRGEKPEVHQPYPVRKKFNYDISGLCMKTKPTSSRVRETSQDLQSNLDRTLQSNRDYPQRHFQPHTQPSNQERIPQFSESRINNNAPGLLQENTLPKEQERFLRDKESQFNRTLIEPFQNCHNRQGRRLWDAETGNRPKSQTPS